MITKPGTLPKFSRWQGEQRRIGLTGGLASGKSTVGNFLQKQKGLPVLDADLYAHEVLAKDTIATEAVLKRYGSKVAINKNEITSALDRSALAKIIFSNKKERLWLENLVHPQVSQKIEIATKRNSKEPIVVIIIPLLFEANFTSMCSEIWLVDCSLEQQYQRVINRDGLSMNEAKMRIDAQWPLHQKRSLADVIIDNNQGYQSWIPQVQALLE